MYARSAALLIAVLLAGIAHAEPARDGQLDPSFGDGGFSLLPVDLAGGTYFVRPRDLLVQADGKYVMAGSGRQSGFFGNWPSVARVLASGQLDPSFGIAGAFVLSPSALDISQGGEATSIAELPDGRLVIVGAVYRGSGFDFKSCLLVFALTSTGQLDTTYGPGPGPACIFFGDPVIDTTRYEPLGSVYSLGDGRVWVTATAGPPVTSRTVMARLDETGMLDTSFAAAGYIPAPTGVQFSLGANAMFADPTTGLTFVIGGRVEGVASRYGAYRLFANGSIDSGFGLDGLSGMLFDGLLAIVSVARDETGRIVVGAKQWMPNNFPLVYCHFCIGRVSASGVLDATFNAEVSLPGQPGRVDYLWENNPNGNGALIAVLPRSQGRTTAVGVADGFHTANGADPDIALMSLREDGTPDPRFGLPSTPGFAQFDFGEVTSHIESTKAAVLDQAGRIVLGGSCNNPCLIRLIDDQVFVDEYE